MNQDDFRHGPQQLDVNYRAAAQSKRRRFWLSRYKTTVVLLSLTDLKAGQCVSIASYEKLNHLGEGSMKGRPHIMHTARLSRS